MLVPLLWSSGGFRHTAALARLGLLSVGAVACVVVGTLALDPGREELPQPPPGREWASRTLPQAVGILAVSLSGHSSLPALRAGMARPSRFPALFTACFGAMAGLYCVVGAAGYWYYGSATLPVITGNLARAGPWVKYRVDTLVAALLFMSCLAKYPAIILVLQDLLVGLGAGATPPAARVAPRASALRALRLALLAATMGVSYAMRHSIAEVMSLVGGVASLSCSLLMPGPGIVFGEKRLRRNPVSHPHAHPSPPEPRRMPRTPARAHVAPRPTTHARMHTRTAMPKSHEHTEPLLPPTSNRAVLFYLVLAWAELGRSTRGALAALLVGGVGLMAFITTQNVLQLLAAFKQ